MPAVSSIRPDKTPQARSCPAAPFLSPPLPPTLTPSRTQRNSLSVGAGAQNAAGVIFFVSPFFSLHVLVGYPFGRLDWLPCDGIFESNANKVEWSENEKNKKHKDVGSTIVLGSATLFLLSLLLLQLCF